MKQNKDIGILLVDDEEVIVKLYTQVLKKQYQQVFSALNGIDALNLLKKEKVNILISDMRMPGMDGNRLTKAVRLNHPEIEIVLSTGKPLEDDEKEELVKLGVHRFLFKPTPPSALLNCVQEIHKKIATHTIE